MVDCRRIFLHLIVAREHTVPITAVRPNDLPPPLFVLELRLRLDGCQSDQEKRQRLAPLFRHWGKQPFIALRDESDGRDPERAAITLVICQPTTVQSQRTADEIMAWCERQLSAWIENYQTTEA